MAITQVDLDSSRPPPKPKRSLNITTPGIPWYRDLKVLRIVAQVIFAIGFIGGLFILASNLTTNLEDSNLALDFGVYKRPFTVAISEGISITEDWGWVNDTDSIAIVVGVVWVMLTGLVGFSLYRQYRRGEIKPTSVFMMAALILFIIIYPPNQSSTVLSDFLNEYLYGGSMSRAFITGIVNTLRVVVISLIACTLVGIIVGVGLLSGNFLVRGVSTIYVEIFRNTPLLVQLFFIYRTLTLILPLPRQSILSPQTIGPLSIDNNLYAINARGFYFASPVPTDSANIVYAAMVIGLVALWYIRRRRMKHQEMTGMPAHTWRIVTPVFIGILAIGWLLAGNPFTVDYPALQGPNIRGGTQYTIGFVSLFLGLTLYTAAFIADIVRAGIQAVSYGQIEAARSQGLTGSQVLNLVVLPQALRLIIPPLGNQYVNLGKNSSLGLVVNYADAYRVVTIANNESGQAVPFFLGLMIIYLALSLLLSAATNYVNRSIQVKTR